MVVISSNERVKWGFSFPETMLFLILYIIDFDFVEGVDFNFIDVNGGDLGWFVGGGDFG